MQKGATPLPFKKKPNGKQGGNNVICNVICAPKCNVLQENKIGPSSGMRVPQLHQYCRYHQVATKKYPDRFSDQGF
jgi:hypothetical protein